MLSDYIPHLDAYAAYLQQRHAQATAKAYLADLRQLAQAAHTLSLQGPLTHLSRAQLRAVWTYPAGLPGQQAPSPATLARRKSALRSLFAFAASGELPPLPRVRQR